MSQSSPKPSPAIQPSNHKKYSNMDSANQNKRENHKTSGNCDCSIGNIPVLPDDCTSTTNGETEHSETQNIMNLATLEQHNQHSSQDDSLEKRRVFLNQIDESGDLWTLQETVLRIQAESTTSDEHALINEEIHNRSAQLAGRCRSMEKLPMLDELIAIQRQLTITIPYSHRFLHLTNLGNSLHARFEKAGRLSDLEEAINCLRESVHLCPTHHPNYAMSLHILARNLVHQYYQSDVEKTLDEAIALNRKALLFRPRSHPDHTSSLANLAVSLWQKFMRTGDLKDIDEGISLQYEVIALQPAHHPKYSSSFANLPLFLCERFAASGERADLDKAILVHRKVVQLPFIGNKGMTLYSFARTLSFRYEHFGERENLEEAISLSRESLSFSAEDKNLMLGLSYRLLMRYLHFGVTDDLEEATHNTRKALSLISPSLINDRQTNFALLNQLAEEEMLHYKQSGIKEYLNEAILLQQSVIDLFPIHENLWDSKYLLAEMLRKRFEDFGTFKDLEKAICLYYDFKAQIPQSNKMQLLKGLTAIGIALTLRFKVSHIEQDIMEALDFHRESAESTSLGHPQFCDRVTHLAETQILANSEYPRGEYLVSSMLNFRLATSSSSSSVSSRIRSCRSWATHAELHAPEFVLEAYEMAINLLPRLFMYGQSIERWQATLVETNDLAGRCAAFAIKSRNFEKAIEMLEAGRAVFWLQALRPRTPFDDLRDKSPELAGILSHISSELERGTWRSMTPGFTANKNMMSVEREINYYNSLHEQWEKRLDEVRRLDGFQNFLKPRSISKLQVAALKGPIVILIASYSGCDALILDSRDIRHINLPNANISQLRNLVSVIHNSSPKGPRQYSLGDSRYGRHFPRKSEGCLGEVLKYLWENVVAPVIQHLKLVKTSSPPIIRWCPTGIFSFLPIHAAGIYAPDMSGIDSAPEYIISSYIPTIGSILGNVPKSSPESKFKMVVAIEPKSLPRTEEELREIEQYAPGDSLVKLGVPGSPATIDAVLENLSSASIVHFACHGRQYNGTPLESALVLDDGDLKISRIMQQRMPNASLAFLCACETAMGDENVPDEAIHIGAALLFSGFKAVIATMWSIEDLDGPVVAGHFYKYLFRTGSIDNTLDISQSARAIHAATAELRSRGALFSRWVPFIHLGN